MGCFVEIGVDYEVKLLIIVIECLINVYSVFVCFVCLFNWFVFNIFCVGMNGCCLNCLCDVGCCFVYSSDDLWLV